MRTRGHTFFALVLAVGLTACGETVDFNDTSVGTRSAATQACLNEVARQTGTTDVRILRSFWSESGTTVISAVGPSEARWFCIGYENGTTGQVYPMSALGG